MNQRDYLIVGILSSFLFIVTLLPKEKRHEPFRESETHRAYLLPPSSSAIAPRESVYEITALSGESVTTNTKGVVLDQGNQAIRVGTSDVMVYTNKLETARFFNSGNVGIGVSSEPSAVNMPSASRVVVSGDLAFTGQNVLSPNPYRLRSYFYDPVLKKTYDYGGMNIQDANTPIYGTSYFYGDWIQVQLPKDISLKGYAICPGKDLGDNGFVNVPNAFQLLGSVDNISWFIIDSQTNQKTRFDGTPYYKYYSVSSLSNYSIFRLVVSEISGNPLSPAGPYLKLSGFVLIDSNNMTYPPLLSENTQVINSNSYTVSTSLPVGNVYTFLNNTIQSDYNNLVGVFSNTYVSSIEPVNSTNYTVFTLPQSTPNYIFNGSTWVSTNLISTFATTNYYRFSSAITFNTIYNGSSPIEAMRIINNGTSGQVGIGRTNPTSNLSVFGSFDTSYMASDVRSTRLGINPTSSNYISLSTAPNKSAITFFSNDGDGTTSSTITGEASIVANSAKELILNAQTVKLLAPSVNLNNVLNAQSIGVGIGTNQPGSLLHVYSLNDTPGLSHTSSTLNLSTTLNSVLNTALIGSSTNSVGLYSKNSPNGVSLLVDSVTGNVGIGTTQPSSTTALTVNGGILSTGTNGIWTGPDTVLNYARLSYNLQTYLDYSNGLVFRSNTSTSTTPSNLITMVLSQDGKVGIGTYYPGAGSSTTSVSYGMDISYSAMGQVDVLRLSNLSATNTTAKSVGMDMVLADTAGLSRMAGRIAVLPYTSDIGSTKMAFYAKTNNTGVEATDMNIVGFMDIDGVTTGDSNSSRVALFRGMNAYGNYELGISNANGAMSMDSSVGDSVLRTTPGKNLILQTGNRRSAIFIKSMNDNNLTNNDTSDNRPRVGIGSTTPTCQFNVFNPISTYSTSLDHPYFCDINGGTAFNGNGGTLISAPSINLQAGNLTWSNNSVNVYGGRIVLNGASSTNGGVTHGTIDFYTSSASAPIVKMGNASYNTTNTYTYFGLNNTYLSTITASLNSYAIYAYDNIISTGSYISISDQRVKKDIQSYSSEESLKKINQIGLYSYKMKDELKDPGTKIGVIAQQVREVVPEAVTDGTDEYVANVLMKCVVKARKVIVEQADHSIKVNDWIRLFSSTSQTVDVQVLNVSGRDLGVAGELQEGEWLIYGTKVEKVLAVDKMSLSMLSIGAIHELTNKCTRLERDNKALVRETERLSHDNEEITRQMLDLVEQVHQLREMIQQVRE